ncbi:hypothetical protein QAD02_018999 [Eretmocerus hayati]|uniref:Uncharacterized protein n=1 Tax=Eretmocerus hayati TaxID=131215 RepID=A0ACC2PID1_9HYME|nr:hypothetical protein QAD02_018999 [Eretmocerus hayati]
MSRDESRRSKRSRVDRDYGVGPAAEIMTYDDERTLDEEEALEASEDTHNELSHLQKESDMPLKDLLIMYGYGDISCCESDLKQFYTEMVKAEENGANNKKSSCVKSNPDKGVEATDSPAEVDANANAASEATKMEVTSNALEASTPDPLTSTNTCNAEIGATVENSNSNAGTNSGNAGGGPSRLLRSVSRPQSEEEEDDCDYSPDEDEWKKTIMVGSDYQAGIPEGLCKYDDALPYENEDKMLWEPYHVQEEEVEEFLERAQLPAVKGTSLPSGSHVRDDEQALYLLLQCGYNLEEALRRRRMNALPSTESVSLWSEEECHNFESGLRNYGKDFHLIQKNKVRTRSVGELVQFYYLWKKTERHDIFTYKARLEKKKYALHPGITDYMDRFLEEQEGVRDRTHQRNHHNEQMQQQTMSTNTHESIINNNEESVGARSPKNISPHLPP